MSEQQANIQPSTLPNPQWAKAKGGGFHRLLSIDPEEVAVERVGGVYVIWHAGLRPKWIFVGKSIDLAATFNAMSENEDVMEYEVNGGIFTSWALIRPELQDGVVRYLHTAMKPLIENPDLPGNEVTPIAVQAPGIATSVT